MNSNNSGFGYHPTQYARLNNGQLYAMFRESIYSRLEDSEKLDLLQETVNRDALEKGMVGAPQVQFADLPATESGKWLYYGKSRYGNTRDSNIGI